MVPVAIAMPRDGNLELASLGSRTMVMEPMVYGTAVKRMVVIGEVTVYTQMRSWTRWILSVCSEYGHQDRTRKFCTMGRCTEDG